MRPLIVGVFAAFVLAAQMMPPAIADAGAVKASLQSLYDRENAAAAEKNVQGTLAYVDPAFRGLDTRGKSMTYDDLVQNATQVYNMAKSIHAETSVGDCKVTAGKATVVTTDTITITVTGPDAQDMVLVDSSTSNDTWTKTKSGWRMTYSHVVAHNATVNGQPAPEMP